MEPLTQSELLTLLRSTGVDVPASAKISSDALDKCFRRVLDAIQYKDRLPAVLDLSSLPEWPTGQLNDTRSLFDAVRRGNLREARLNMAAAALGMDCAQPGLFTDAFEDLRQTVMGLGKYLDHDVKWCVLDDSSRQYMLCLRVTSVLEVNQKTPAIVVLYRAFRNEEAFEYCQWITDQVDHNPASVGRVVPKVKATVLEQKLLARLLDHNAQLLPSDLVVDRQRLEGSFRVSVLLPVGPLESDALAKLNNHLGCQVCGKKAGNRCSRCQAVPYCGKQCQRADWGEHKTLCRSLMSGKWCTIRFKSCESGHDVEPLSAETGRKVQHIAFLNHRSSTHLGFSDRASSIRQIDAECPPPNVWGDRLFLLKLQIKSLGRDSFLLYDRKRSFQVFVCRDDDPGVFDELYEEMQGPRGGHEGHKMYRWARRSGDWELSVCLDRAPISDTQW